VGKPSLYAAQPYAKAEGRVFLLVPAYPGSPGTKAVKRVLLLLLWFGQIQMKSHVFSSDLLYSVKSPHMIQSWFQSNHELDLAVIDILALCWRRELESTCRCDDPRVVTVGWCCRTRNFCIAVGSVMSRPQIALTVNRPRLVSVVNVFGHSECAGCIIGTSVTSLSFSVYLCTRPSTGLSALYCSSCWCLLTRIQSLRTIVIN